jgi:hypothetical protein
MTQKSVAKPSARPNAAAAPGKVVVFGLDSNWRPHAAWFPDTQAEPARAAAKQLRLNVIEVTNGTAADLIAKLPAGQIHAAGPAMVPPVREDLYEKVVATLNPRAKPVGKRATQIQPTSPKLIGTGSSPATLS